MKLLIAPDSFKESLSAAGVAEALACGWRGVRPGDEIVCVPMADGGEGTVEALVAATGGTTVSVPVTGPLGDTVTAQYGILGDGATAVIEMAAASGLELVTPDQRDPMRATTYGTGELMKHALDQGVRKILLGIGGSATNDGGAGMAQALGYRLLDATGNDLPPGGGTLAALDRIVASNAHPSLKDAEILIACDVDNPLYGPQGASQVYGPQKGATPEQVEVQVAALAHYARIIERDLGIAVAELPGAGAAGGLGAGLVAFAGGTLGSGVELVAEACNLAERMAGADLVITGEGRIDGQTVYGKTPIGVAKIAQAQGIPVIAVAGCLGDGYETVLVAGIDKIYRVSPESMPLEEALREAPNLLQKTDEAIAREWNVTHP